MNSSALMRRLDMNYVKGLVCHGMPLINICWINKWVDEWMSEWIKAFEWSGVKA